jgi:hypothetical protein
MPTVSDIMGVGSYLALLTSTGIAFIPFIVILPAASSSARPPPIRRACRRSGRRDRIRSEPTSRICRPDNRQGFKVPVHGLDDICAHRQMGLFLLPTLHEEPDRLARCIHDELSWQCRLGGEMGEFIFGELVKPPRSAEVQRGLIAGDVGEG